MSDKNDLNKLLVQPKYLKVSSKCRHQDPFTKNVFLAQELNVSDSSIWCLQFSHDGKYLAAGGEDSVIRIFKVISSPLDRLKYEDDLAEETFAAEDLENDTFSFKSAGNSFIDGKRSSSHSVTNSNSNFTGTGKTRNSNSLYSPLLHSKPVKVFKGHTQDILSLDWSKNNFLLSASMDRTTKLWHVDREECLATFDHLDFVTCARFHPEDDRFFVSGCLDKKIRFWSILEKKVLYSREVGSMITACTFHPDGESIVCGTINGLLYMLKTKKLKIEFQFDLRKNNIKSSGAAKISGLQCFKDYVLITTNDSRIRLFNLKTRKILIKYKGFENTSSQGVAVVSSDYNSIISGSEDHHIYMWHVADKDFLQKQKKNFFKSAGTIDTLDNVKNTNYYAIHAHNAQVTNALFVPPETKKWLYLSNDLIYDLNKAFIEFIENSNQDYVNILSMVLSNTSLHSDESSLSRFNENDAKYKKIAEFLGNKKTHSAIDLLALLEPMKFEIVVSADSKGKIRIFRSDSAYHIRKIIRDDLSKDSVGLQPFLKALNVREDQLNAFKLHHLTLDDTGTIVKTSKQKLAMLRKSRRNTRATNASANDDNDSVLGSVKSAVGAPSANTAHGDTNLRTLMANETEEPLISPKFFKNGGNGNTFYSLGRSSSGNTSLSSLLRNRSSSVASSSTNHGRDVCDVCEGSNFTTKKVDYKNSSTLVKICHDCGNQIKRLD